MTVQASIVIPLLRQDDGWLRRSVESALVQTVEAEVIVITSPRTPSSNLERLDRLGQSLPAGKRLRVAERTRDSFPNAINTGVAVASADRVGLLFSDDWLDPQAIEETLAVDADIVATGAVRYNEHGGALEHLRRPMDSVEYAKRTTFESKASYLTHFLLLRKSAVDDAGGLDESLGDAPGIDDYDLIWTMLERDATVGLTARPLYNHTIHGGDRLTLRSRDEQRRTLERIFDKHGFYGEARARRMKEHAHWFGRREDVAWSELGR